MPAQTFKKKERLKGRKEIEALLRKGKSKKIDDIQIRWVEFNNNNDPTAKVLISVPKKIFKKAVDRNLLKRRMREAYRRNKNQLIEHFSSNNKSINLMFIYYAETINTYSEIENKIVLLLKGLYPPNEKHS